MTQLGLNLTESFLSYFLLSLRELHVMATLPMEGRSRGIVRGVVYAAGSRLLHRKNETETGHARSK